jgi:hypothetical protein
VPSSKGVNTVVGTSVYTISCGLSVPVLLVPVLLLPYSRRARNWPVGVERGGDDMGWKGENGGRMGERWWVGEWEGSGGMVSVGWERVDGRKRHRSIGMIRLSYPAPV